MFYQIVLVYYSFMSVLAFALYGIDKRRARKKQWRIKESSLLWISFLGGSVGAMLGMKAFRHKTQHHYFWLIGFLGLVWQGALAFFLMRMGY